MYIVGGIMVSVLVLGATGLGFDPQLDHKIGICCFSAKYATLTSKIDGLGISIMCPI